MNTNIIISWVAQIILVVLLASTFPHKFLGSATSKMLFTTLGIEPWGRILIGVLEVIAVILLLIPATSGIGGLYTVGIGLGAVLSHLLVLGIVHNNDSGFLFISAVLLVVLGLVVAFMRLDQLLVLKDLIISR